MDRRSGMERRRSERHRMTVDIEWENHAGRSPGTLGDLSPEGCFVMAAGDFAEGERVYIYLPGSGGDAVRLTGEVTNHVFEIGFAARFVDPGENEQAFIRDFIAAHGEEAK
ncbi:MAG: PilZ domain-containing protein [Acidobacteria bacterium]|nr:PilZ domain-containing protein [Acidobacteriota bacterium]